MIRGAVFGQSLPGSTGLLWPARSHEDEPAMEDALNAAALTHIGDAKLIQAFLSPEESDRVQLLNRCGFQRLLAFGICAAAFFPRCLLQANQDSGRAGDFRAASVCGTQSGLIQ